MGKEQTRHQNENTNRVMYSAGFHQEKQTRTTVVLVVTYLTYLIAEVKTMTIWRI